MIQMNKILLAKYLTFSISLLLIQHITCIDKIPKVVKSILKKTNYNRDERPQINSTLSKDCFIKFI